MRKIYPGLWQCSDCGTVGRVVASNSRDLQFESIRGQIFEQNIPLTLVVNRSTNLVDELRHWLFIVPSDLMHIELT